MSAPFASHLIDSTICREELGIFRFSRPEGHSFVAGQWLRLTLPTAQGEQTLTFTHASAPGDDWIEIATRLSGSPFKNALAALAQGDEVRMLGPGGRLTLPAETRAVVLLAGGVGITPARSMLRDRAQSNIGFDDALLVYGNRNPECVLYREEIDALAGPAGSGLRVAHVFEHGAGGGQVAPSISEHAGLISAELLHDLVSEPGAVPWVVAGPPGMAVAMVDALDELGVPDQMRHIEWFGPRS